MPRKSLVLVKMSTDTDPWNIAVSTVATMWVPYHLLLPAPELAAAQPETAPAMVRMWSKMRKNPHRDGMRRRERVRKMQLEAAPRSM